MFSMKISWYLLLPIGIAIFTCGFISGASSIIFENGKCKGRSWIYRRPWL